MADKKKNKKSTSKAEKQTSTQEAFLPDLATLYPVSKVALERFELTDYRRRVLGERAFQLLRGTNSRPPIFNLLQQKGFDQQQVEIGWALLRAANGTYVLQPPQEVSTLQLAAEAELDQWDEPNFAMISASLAVLYPEQADYLFKDLEPQQGPASVMAIATLLERVSFLEEGSDPGRKDTREEDKAAVEELAQTGLLTKKARQELEKLIELAQAPPQDETRQAAIFEEQRAYQEDALKRLGLWYTKWSTIARRMLKKRSYLITLGLAERRSPKKTEEIQEPTPTDNITEPEQTTTNGTNGEIVGVIEANS